MKSKNDRLILKALGDSPVPLTAYTLLDTLRPEGISAPPTVYRSLNRLMEKGLIHRISNLNAYTCCPQAHQPSEASCEEKTHLPVLLLCESCGRSFEIEDVDLTHRLERNLKVHGFKPRSMTFEILGICQTCQSPHGSL